MSKELIESLKRQANLYPDPKVTLFTIAADRIEQLEADTQEVKAARIYLREQERLLRQLAAAQKRIELYEQALKASWPEGAMGAAFDYWNAARKEDV